jgi:hypothetical protein
MSQPGEHPFIPQSAQLEENPKNNVKKSPEQRISSVFRPAAGENDYLLYYRDKEYHDGPQDHQAENYFFR